MSFMDKLKDLLGRDRVKRSVLTFDDTPSDAAWILPEVHYVRVRLVEMFITKKTWLGKSWYPALHGLVKATYGSGDIELPSVADTSKLFEEQAGTGDVVARNFYLTPLLALSRQPRGDPLRTLRHAGGRRARQGAQNPE